MIIATAGHVDHGKTTLVRALTGIDTDRLPEEKQRGMTIELGFAYAASDASTGIEALAFVDVPGHERFVRNMLAGVAAIDLALLVVAADDGPMPQTLEHLAILRLLGVPRLVVALSKADRVAPARLAEVQAQLQASLAQGPWAGAAIFPVVAPTGAGVDALRHHLCAAATARVPPALAGHFRLAVDRSFLLAGAGRIVTGTVLSGQVQVGDALLLSPQGAAMRVRGLHAHSRPSQQARAGQRCAINLAGEGLRQADPQRGDWLLAPAAHAPTDRLDVRLQVLASEARPLAQRGSLHLHIGACACLARAVPLAGAALAPGSEGWAQLVLDRPVCAVWGDRFILRDAAGNRTVAGGTVIDPAAPARGRNRPERLRQLAALARTDPADALSALLADAPDGVDLARFHRARNHRADEAALLQAGAGLHRLAGPAGPMGLGTGAWQDWRGRVLVAADACHADQPDSLGPDDADLRRRLALASGAGAARAVLRAVLADLVADGQLLRDGLAHRRPGHCPRLRDDDQALLGRVLAQLPPDGLRPPITGELAAALALPLDDLKASLARMVQHGALVRVAPNRHYRPETVRLLADHACALAAASPEGRFDAASFRDRTGIGRNLTIQVLEHLSKSGVTRFDGTWHRPLVG